MASNRKSFTFSQLYKMALVPSTSSSVAALLKLPSAGSSGGTRTLPIGSSIRPSSSASGSEGIQFGRAPGSATKSPTPAPSAWGSLLSNVLTGGISGAFGGGGLLSDVTGLLGMFDSKKQPAALTPFQLPASQEMTEYVSSRGSAVYQGTDVEHQVSTPAPAAAPSVAEAPLTRSDVIDTVRQALLTSSSLNDVISDL